MTNCAPPMQSSLCKINGLDVPSTQGSLAQDTVVTFGVGYHLIGGRVKVPKKSLGEFKVPEKIVSQIFPNFYPELSKFPKREERTDTKKKIHYCRIKQVQIKALRDSPRPEAVKWKRLGFKIWLYMSEPFNPCELFFWNFDSTYHYFQNFDSFFGTLTVFNFGMFFGTLPTPTVYM